MPGFQRDARGSALLCDVVLSSVLARPELRTPLYAYDLDAIRAGATELVAAFGARRGLVAYAIKANSAGSIVRTLREAGTGADVVSGGELELALACKMRPAQIVMSGVAKSDAEIDQAIALGIRAIQAESVEELRRIAARTRAAKKRAKVSVRVNPAVDIDAHAHVRTGHDAAKFGVVQGDLGLAWEVLREHSGELALTGVSTHVGSMLDNPEPYLSSARVVCSVARERLSAGEELEFVDFGGGFGIDYGNRKVQSPARFVERAVELLEAERLSDLELVIEPGRSLVGPHGVLLSRVLQEKQSGSRRWLMLDAGMNDLLRPALYGACHRIEPLDRPPGGATFRVVGPVCESADDFGEHPIGEPTPDYVVIRDAGAYGYSMASEYNGRALPGEVFLSGGAIVKHRSGHGVQVWIEGRLGS